MGQRGRPRHPELLTPREQEVLALIRSGLTNSEIGERLGISVETVKQHVSEIFSRLGVATREEAAAWQPESEPRRRWSLGGILLAAAGTSIVAAAFAGIALLAWGVSQTGTTDQASANLTPLNQLVDGPIYYLPPADTANWIASPDVVGEAGIHVDNTPDELISEAIEPTAVIIDKDRMGQIETSWLMSELNRGTVIVAGRTDITHLKQWLRVNHDQSGDWSYLGNFFSLYEQCQRPGGATESAIQQYLDHGQAGFRFMLNIIQVHSPVGHGCDAVTP